VTSKTICAFVRATSDDVARINKERYTCSSHAYLNCCWTITFLIITTTRQSGKCHIVRFINRTWISLERPFYFYQLKILTNMTDWAIRTFIRILLIVAKTLTIYNNTMTKPCFLPNISLVLFKKVLLTRPKCKGTNWRLHPLPSGSIQNHIQGDRVLRTQK